MRSASKPDGGNGTARTAAVGANGQRSQRPIWLGEDRRQWDHVRLHVQLLKDERIDAFDIAVYCGIAAHAETRTGEAHPSERTLASYAGISERKARDCARKLEELRYLDIEPRPGKASIYALLPPPSYPHPGTSCRGAPIDPGTSRQQPRNPGAQTPAPRSDELELDKSQQRERWRGAGESNPAIPPPFSERPPFPPRDPATAAKLRRLRRERLG